MTLSYHRSVLFILITMNQSITMATRKPSLWQPINRRYDNHWTVAMATKTPALWQPGNRRYGSHETTAMTTMKPPQWQPWTVAMAATKPPQWQPWNRRSDKLSTMKPRKLQLLIRPSGTMATRKLLLWQPGNCYGNQETVVMATKIMFLCQPWNCRYGN